MMRRALPWRRLKVGDSFVFPPARSLRATQCQATARAAYQRSKHGRTFAVRTLAVAGLREVRVWRTA